MMNVTRGFLALGMSAMMLVPLMSGCAGSPTLGDPRQMTFKPVEFSPPEPDRVVFENGMVVYLLRTMSCPWSA